MLRRSTRVKALRGTSPHGFGCMFGEVEDLVPGAARAAFIRVEDRPLFAWRMHDYRQRYAERIDQLAPAMQRVREQLTEHGPQFVRDLETGPREKRGPWWDWSDTKRAVEMLFAVGEVVTAGRERFERRYAIAEQVLPKVALRTVDRETTQRAHRAGSPARSAWARSQISPTITD